MKSRSDMLYVLLSAAVLLFAFQRCSDDTPTEPPPTTNDTTSHEFTWEVDTLFWTGTNIPAFFTAKAMYATSATNVYMAGYSTSMSGSCWRWDGIGWNAVNQLHGFRDVVDFDGLDSSYLVFTGQNTGPSARLRIINNGELEELPPPTDVQLTTCLHVASRNEIYLGGVDGIQRYNGSEWEWLLDTTTTSTLEFHPQYIHKFRDGTLEFVSQEVPPGKASKMHLWRWKENAFALIDTFSLDQDVAPIRFGYRVYDNGSEVYSTGGGGTFLYESGAWRKLFDIGGLFVSGTRNNLIFGQSWTNVWHYNGSTTVNLWREIREHAPLLDFIHGITFIDGHLFICGELIGSRDAVVIRGTQVKQD